MYCQAFVLSLSQTDMAALKVFFVDYGIQKNVIRKYFVSKLCGSD